MCVSAPTNTVCQLSELSRRSTRYDWTGPPVSGASQSSRTMPSAFGPTKLTVKSVGSPGAAGACVMTVPSTRRFADAADVRGRHAVGARQLVQPAVVVDLRVGRALDEYPGAVASASPRPRRRSAFHRMAGALQVRCAQPGSVLPTSETNGSSMAPGAAVTEVATAVPADQGPNPSSFCTRTCNQQLAGPVGDPPHGSIVIAVSVVLTVVHVAPAAVGPNHRCRWCAGPRSR